MADAHNGGTTLVGLAQMLAQSGNVQTSGMVRRMRDISLLPLTEESALVVACDSLGAIGPKAGDAIVATGEDVGYFTARVPLLEVICAGATPLIVVDALAVEMEPTGQTILAGVRIACVEAGIDPSLAISGSTEENVPTHQTGVGIMVLGIAPLAALRPGTSKPGDGVYLVGTPKSAPGQHVFRDDLEMVTLESVRALRSQPGVHDLLPIGSKGAAWEAQQIASSAGLMFQPEAGIDPDLLQRSGGPATSVLASASTVPSLTDTPVQRIGTLIVQR